MQARLQEKGRNLIRIHYQVGTKCLKNKASICQNLSMRRYCFQTSSYMLILFSYHPHLVQTLKKWSAKIQAVAPSALLPSNRNVFSKNNNNLKSAVQLVDDTMVDYEKLLARTRVWRGKGSRIGAEPTPVDQEPKPDLEIFDDTDFYQQLLRDVIDSQSGKGGEDWVAIQKQKKAKKKVDTKASKGRKLRYGNVTLASVSSRADGISDMGFTKSYRILWFPFRRQAPGMKNRSTSCLHPYLERALRM
jgi:hypothetical protein